jgi:hypothetical protein
MRNLVCGNKTSFGNPCGQNLSSDIDAFLCGLERGESLKELAAHLLGTIKIRSVQAMPPSQALGFVQELKNVLRAQYKEVVHSEVPVETFVEWLTVLDAAALAAFDLYTEQRELVATVRINDVKRRVSGLISRIGFSEDDVPAARAVRDASMGDCLLTNTNSFNTVRKDS